MVNTFLVGTLEETCSALDSRRLNKQLVEAHQILKGSWKHHPCSKMWFNYHDALKTYANAIRKEVIRRGIACSLPHFTVTEVTYPWWFDWKPLHQSHIASLLRKDPSYYSTRLTLSDEEYRDRGYIWPIDHNESIKNHDSAYKLCRQVGMGAPATYRWSLAEVKAWITNPNVNPKTGRKINPKAKTGVAVDIRKAAKLYGLA